MTPQKQSILSDKSNGIYGNCLVTCYASYFDLKADECPQFQFLFDCKSPEGFWDEVVALWLRQMGYVRQWTLDNDPFITEQYEDYYFASGVSSRGVSHLVIYKDGKLFHDPHPSNDGLVEVTCFHTLAKIR